MRAPDSVSPSAGIWPAAWAATSRSRAHSGREVASPSRSRARDGFRRDRGNTVSTADDDAPYRERARRTPAPSAEPSGRDLQRRLAHEGDLYRLLVQSVRDYAIFMLDPTGIIASWNEGAQRIKGYSATEII